MGNSYIFLSLTSSKEFLDTTCLLHFEAEQMLFPSLLVLYYKLPVILSINHSIFPVEAVKHDFGQLMLNTGMKPAPTQSRRLTLLSQNSAAKAAADNFIPWEEPLYFDASSTYCPSVGQNLPPGLLNQKQFRFLLQLVQIRAHNAVKLLSPQKVKPEERLLVMAHAERFQRFAWQFYSHSDIATDEFARQFFLDTISQQSAPGCCAGAEADEDTPTFKPKRTRKRRPEEAETRPPRKQLAKDEADTAAANASVPPPTYTAATHTAKQETDVDMGQPQSSQPCF